VGYDGLYFNIFVRTQQEDEWVINLKFSGSFEIARAKMLTRAQDLGGILQISQPIPETARPTHNFNTSVQTKGNR
jgi:hypothetical protein